MTSKNVVQLALSAASSLKGRSVTRIIIVPERSPYASELVPAVFTSDAGGTTPAEELQSGDAIDLEDKKTQERAEAELASVLGEVGSVEAFRWNTWPPVGTSLWPALQKHLSASLTSLEVVDAAEFADGRAGAEDANSYSDAEAPTKRAAVHDSSLFDQRFPKLRQFSYICYSYNHGVATPDLSRLGPFLAAAKDLEVLDLHFQIHGDRYKAPSPAWSADATLMLSSNIWPKLRILRVNDVRATAAALSIFLRNHAGTLEEVVSTYSSVEGEKEDGLGQGALTELPDGVVLPHLRRLEVDGLDELAKKLLR